MMPRVKNNIAWILVISACLFTFGTVVSCSNNGPIAPDDIQDNVLNPPDTPTENDPNDPDVTDPDDNTLQPSDEITTEGISNLSTALRFLKSSGGGVLTTALQIDEFAIHLWDADTLGALDGQAIVKCEGGPTSLVDINGAALFENASFPLTVTVYVSGYGLSTYVETSANVLSFPLTRIPDYKEDSYLFGVSESLGNDLMEFYSDDLLPDIYYETPILLEPDFIPFEIQVEPLEPFGFSAFLRGAIQFGDPGEGHPPVSPSPAFWMTNHFAWNFEPLYPGDHMFYGIQFDAKPPPDGLAIGDAVAPLTAPEMADILKYGRLMAVPTVIFIESEKYLTIGPGNILSGDDPGNLTYRCPWFEPTDPFDRVVISGQLVNPDGAVNIIHSNWHLESAAPSLDFSGFATIGIQGGFSGVSYPNFTLTDPMSSTSDLVRITAQAEDIGSVWVITLANGVAAIDTADYLIPLTWLGEVYSDFTIQYQVEMIDALSQNIDDFNKDQIIMTREEISISPWTDPAL